MSNDVRVMFSCLIIAIFTVFIGCSDTSGLDVISDVDVDVDVVLQSVVQTGGQSTISDSTGLTLVFDVDPSSLTADDITITGATKGSLSGTGISRSLTISNISVDDGDTITVSVSNPSGYSISDSSKAVVVYKCRLSVGDAYQGGIIGYIFKSTDNGYVSGEIHGLICAEANVTATYWVEGGSTQTTRNGNTSLAIGYGQANTTAMMNQTGYSGGAAKSCNDYSVTDSDTGTTYDDWYLPSYDEFNKFCANYSTIGLIARYYWTSSESSASGAWTIRPSDKSHLAADKSSSMCIRPVRSF